jgi:hypothetical protein
MNMTADSCKPDDKTKEIDITLDNVTTIQFTYGTIISLKEWFICALPHLNHLILSSEEFSSKDNKLIPILNNRIQRLDINSYIELEQLAQTNYIYFINVEQIYVILDYVCLRSKAYANIIIRILETFKNLKTLTVYSRQHFQDSMISTESVWIHLIDCLNINEIPKIYQIKYYQKYLCLSKKS